MNPDVDRGIRAHLDEHFGAIAAGDPRLGWKIAFNAPAVQKLVGISGSLLAGLRRSTVLEGASFAIGASRGFAAEAEVFVTLGRDVDARGDAAAAAAAVRAWGPAIEVVEFDRPLGELEAILTEGVFHRGVLFGEPSTVQGAPSLSGVRAVVRLGAEPLCEVDAHDATGDVGEVLLAASRIIEPHGQRLAASDTVILGSMNPLAMVVADQEFSLSLGDFPEVCVRFVR